MYLVTAVRAGAYERVSAFFSANGERLLQGQGAEAWSRWFALPYLSPEAAQAELQVACWRAACWGSSSCPALSQQAAAALTASHLERHDCSAPGGGSHAPGFRPSTSVW